MELLSSFSKPLFKPGSLTPSLCCWSPCWPGDAGGGWEGICSPVRWQSTVQEHHFRALAVWTTYPRSVHGPSVSPERGSRKPEALEQPASQTELVGHRPRQSQDESGRAGSWWCRVKQAFWAGAPAHSPSPASHWAEPD